MKVIETFSLYTGAVVWIHSILWTGVTAFAILHFTVKLSRISKHGDDNKKMRRQVGLLIILFSLIEFLLGAGYHIIWFNQEAGLDTFTIPDFTPAFIFTLFLDTLLPATLYFYGHTVHIKTETEKELIEQKGDETPKFEIQAPLAPGDQLLVEVPGFGEKSLIIKNVKLKVGDPEEKD
jgi:hypothetical protein